MSLQEKLLIWYKNHKRDLPWRKTTDPFKIWISEIILQQTRVNQGLGYYLKFTERYPTIKNLADAPIDEVMLLWKGLGYYTRARNLHETAKYIQRALHGNFPDKYTDLIKLKGIGSYTAAAIASIAFKEAKAVVDGNVVRVYARLFNINEAFNSAAGKKIFDKIAAEMLETRHPGDYNQAIMEFGALQCTPVNPDCSVCVLNSNCIAYEKKLVEKLPVKLKKAAIKKRYFYFLIIQHDNKVYIEKRKDTDIWHSLYQFPLIETTSFMGPENIFGGQRADFIGLPENFEITAYSNMIKHQLTHQNIFAFFIHLKTDEILGNKEFMLVDETSLKNYALPRLIDKYWNEYQSRY